MSAITKRNTLEACYHLRNKHILSLNSCQLLLNDISIHSVLACSGKEEARVSIIGNARNHGQIVWYTCLQK